MKKSVTIDPLDAFFWTFRRSEKDVINLYNSLSDVMRLATGGNMLNFGYWTDSTKEPIEAQAELCNIFAELAELESAKIVVDTGSGLAAPSALWKSQFNFLQITCLNINFNELKQSKEIIDESLGDSADGVYRLNATSNALPFKDHSADRVLALESAQHVKPIESFISESKRVLKNDGIFALAIPVVNKKTIPIVKLGILSFTWSSEHYTTDYIKSSLIDAGFDILQMQKIGSHVFTPLANYYIEHRNSIKEKILSKYPAYLEKLLFKSMQKMKQVSEADVIDYLLVKCRNNIRDF